MVVDVYKVFQFGCDLVALICLSEIVHYPLLTKTKETFKFCGNFTDRKFFISVCFFARHEFWLFLIIYAPSDCCAARQSDIFLRDLNVKFWLILFLWEMRWARLMVVLYTTQLTGISVSNSKVRLGLCFKLSRKKKTYKTCGGRKITMTQAGW